MYRNNQDTPKVNIVATNYGSRYGTSVYKNLYGESSASHKSLHGLDSRRTPVNRGGRSISRSGTPISNKSSSTPTKPKKALEEKMVGKISLERPERTSLDNATIKSESSKKSKIRRKYKSLLSSSSKKLINKIYDHHPASDTFSIFSNITSHSHTSKNTEPTVKKEPITFNISETPLATFNELPVEIIAYILSTIQTEQRTLISCLYVNKKVYAASKLVLYEKPYFTSTYRVAQFVTSIRLHPENGTYVKSLDLSKLKSGLITAETENGNTTAATADETGATTPGNAAESNFPTLTTTQTQGTTNSSSPVNDELKQDLAYASWRDWRYRNEPLYSSPLLSTFNLKRVNSRSSSIHSNSSGLTNSGNNARRHRSNSSVSSFTSSIMSSLYTTPHISLSTTTSSGQNNSSPNSSTFTSLSRKRSPNPSEGVTTKKVANRDNNSNKSTSSNSRWFNKRLSSRQKKGIVAPKPTKNVPKPIISTDDSDLSSALPKNRQIKIRIEEPFRTRHPYTNKFLLKYAPYRDLPLGYILHLLKNCPNLNDLNLSNLVICSDFELIDNPNKKGKRRPSSSLLLSTVQEGISDKSNNLDIVYMTDSSKNYDYYENLAKQGNERRSSVLSNNPDTWMKGNSNWHDYPLPIDSQTRYREEHKRNNIGNSTMQLRKLNPCEIFATISKTHNQNGNNLKNIKMDGVVWCRQYMVKYFILNALQKLNRDEINKQIDNNEVMQFSFENSGLNTNFAWACNGNLFDFVCLIALDEVAKRDDLGLEELFRIKKERLFYKSNLVRDPDVMDVSEIFDVEYGATTEEQKKINFRLTILRGEGETRFRVRKLSSSHVSLVINLSTTMDVDKPIPENQKRIHNLTTQIVGRLRELRSDDLRRNVGENNYIRERVI